MHTKRKGNLGEFAVMKQLISNGYSVFTEFGDISRVDLIAIVDNKPVTIQVKARMSTHGMVQVDTRKRGPNYSFRYSEEDVDMFAVYAIDRDMIFYVTSKELLNRKSTMTFRLDPAKNKQKKSIIFASDYTSFEEVLRGHEQNTLTDKAEGNDMVQTTTKQ